MEVTFEPEQLTPRHDWPHGSPPFAVQLCNCDGELKLWNNTFSADTAFGKK